MRYAIAAGLAAAVVAMGVSEHRADACGCSGLGAIHPVDAATDVALDTVVILVSDQLEALQVHVRITGQATEVSTVTELHEGWALVRPAQPLAASTSYSVEVDREFVASKTTTFVTGTRSATPPLAYGGIAAFAPETMGYPPPSNGSGSGCGDSCVQPQQSGQVSRIRVTHAAVPVDAVLLALRLVDPATHQITSEIALGDGSAASTVLGFAACGPRSPTLQPGVAYCAQVVAYDEAGHVAGSATELCAAAATCAPAFEPGTCAPADACDLAVGDGAATTPDAGSPIAHAGGGGCAAARDAHGLVLAAGLLSLVAARRRRRRSYCKLVA